MWLVARKSMLNFWSYGRNLCKVLQIAVQDENNSGMRICTSAVCCDLMEFFDDSKNWGEQVVRSGRSWRIEELRIKSNIDLHKLWYILLKERNMLLTMEQASKDECELFPSPERIDKVEDSMQRLEEVVRERNKAYYLLETGSDGERPQEITFTGLGLRRNRRLVEHAIPWQMNKNWQKIRAMTCTFKENDHFLRLYREKNAKQFQFKVRQQYRKVQRILQRFPDTTDEDIEANYPLVDVQLARRKCE